MPGGFEALRSILESICILDIHKARVAKRDTQPNSRVSDFGLQPLIVVWQRNGPARFQDYLNLLPFLPHEVLHLYLVFQPILVLELSTLLALADDSRQRKLT